MYYITTCANCLTRLNIYIISNIYVFTALHKNIIFIHSEKDAL